MNNKGPDQTAFDIRSVFAWLGPYDVASEGVIKPCIKNDKPLVDKIWKFVHLRNRFHFSEVHGSMNATGPVQS